MSKVRAIISSLIILLLLSSIYLYLNYNRKVSIKEQRTDVNVNTDIIHINENQLIGITFSSEGDSGTIKRVNGKWIMLGHSFSLDQETMEILAGDLSSIIPIKAISCKEKDLAEYGLVKPKRIVTAIMINKKEKVFYLGDKIPTGNGYYVKLKDDPRVFVVESDTGEILNIKINNLIDKSIPYINSETINYIKIVQYGEPIIELMANENRTSDEIAFGLNGWKLTKPYKGVYSVDLGRTDNIINGIKNMTLMSFEADTDNLEKYGLIWPHTEVLLKDKENHILLLSFGKQKDRNSVYVKISNKQGIYSIGREFENLFRITPIGLIERFAFIASIYDVDKVIIKKKDAGNIFEIVKSIHNKNDATISVSYRINGKQISKDAGKNFYQKLLGLIFDVDNNKIVKEKPEVSTIFFLNKGVKRKIIVNYCPYNSEFYAVFRDGKCDFLISKLQVDNMLNELEKLK